MVLFNEVNVVEVRGRLGRETAEQDRADGEVRRDQAAESVLAALRVDVAELLIAEAGRANDGTRARR